MAHDACNVRTNKGKSDTDHVLQCVSDPAKRTASSHPPFIGMEIIKMDSLVGVVTINLGPATPLNQGVFHQRARVLLNGLNHIILMELQIVDLTDIKEQ